MYEKIGRSLGPETENPQECFNLEAIMQVIDISELSQQFAGRKFGELVLQYAPPQSSKFVIEALNGTVNKLPSEAKADRLPRSGPVGMLV